MKNIFKVALLFIFYFLIKNFQNTTLDFTNLNACHKTVRISKQILVSNIWFFFPESLLHIFWLPHVYFPFSYNLEESRNLYNIEIHESGNITLSKRYFELDFFFFKRHSNLFQIKAKYPL